MSLYRAAVLASNPVCFYQFDEDPYNFYYEDAVNLDDLTEGAVPGYDISEYIDPGDVTSGRNSYSGNARKGSNGLLSPASLGQLSGFTYEFWIKLNTAGTYTLLESVSNTTDTEVLANISALPSSPSTLVLKFGMGVGNWSIDSDTEHRHIYVYSDEVADLFDDKWHHVVLVWDGDEGYHWRASELAIYIDGVRRDDEDTREEFADTLTIPPLVFEDPFYICGPATGANTYDAEFDDVAVYGHALSEAEVVAHYNSSASIEASLELDEADSFIRTTNGEIETVFEEDFPQRLGLAVSDLVFQAESSISVAAQTPDMLASRDFLGTSGSISVDLSSATLEAGEPNSAGFTKTCWYDLRLNPDFTERQRITLTSSTSVGRVVVYKQPSLDDYDDYIDLDEEERINQDPMLSEPSLNKLSRVQSGSADQVFTLDPEYGSSYFLQVGLISGPGDDFTLTWGDADPSEGGGFSFPVEGSLAFGEATINSMNAWLESGEPNSPSITETRSVWLRWTAPETVDAPTVFTIRPSELDIPFAVGIFTGTSVNALTQVTNALSTDGTQVELTITATPETVYYIRVATTIDGADFVINWSAPRKDYPPAEPVTQLRVTVHAGPAGAKYNGTTYAPNQMITELPRRIGAQFQERLNTPGSGTLTLLQSDMMMRAFNPEDWPAKDSDSWTGTTQSTWGKDPFQLVQMGNIVKFWMFNSTKGESGKDDCVSAFVIKSREITIVGAGEDADRMITVSGPTVHQLLNDFVVLHDNWPTVRSSQTRAFNWTSIYGSGDEWTSSASGWFDSSGTFNSNKRAWNHPINTSNFGKPPGWKKKRNEAYTKRPKYALVAKSKKKNAKRKWRDKSSKWMWMGSNRAYNQNKNFPPAGMKIAGHHYYRSKSFTVPSSGRYQFDVYSDTLYRIYLDGELLIAGDGNESYTKFKTVKRSIAKSDGKNVTHTLAVYVKDKDSGDSDHNDAFLLSVKALNAKGQTTTAIIRSQSTARWYAWHGANPPQWSRAMILATVIREAKARGNHSAKALYLRPDFGKKSEEGAKWWDEKSVGMNVDIGTSALQLAEKFSESNRFDVWVDPDDLSVKVWQGSSSDYPRGTNKSNNVALVPGHNLINYTVTEIDEMKNSLVVRYDNGHIYVNNDNPELRAKYGSREGYLELGDLNNKEAARAQARRIVSWTGKPTSIGGSGDIVGHIVDEYNGSIVPVKGSVPFLDFNVGDIISAPGSNGMLHPHRVLALTCTEDTEGNLTFDPELESI